MKEEKVYFENPRGVKLCGILSNPTANKANPIVVLCHGSATGKDNYTNTQLVPILSKEGISTFRFDFFGHGESEGEFENLTISEGVDDELTAIEHLKSLGYSRIGLFGASFGGLTSIMVASKIEDLRMLVLKSPPWNLKECALESMGEDAIEEWRRKGFKFYLDGQKRKHRLNYSFFEDYDNNNGYEAAEKIDVPTFIVHGREDKAIPIEQSIKASKILSNCQLEIMEGAGHGYSGPGQFDKMIDLLSEFIIKNLKK